MQDSVNPGNNGVIALKKVLVWSGNLRTFIAVVYIYLRRNMAESCGVDRLVGRNDALSWSIRVRICCRVLSDGRKSHLNCNKS
jgi:hypothetical protein